MSKGHVKRSVGGYIIAAIITAAVLGALIWLFFRFYPSGSDDDSVALKKTPVTTGTSAVTGETSNGTVTQSTTKPAELIKVGTVKLENNIDMTQDGEFCFKWAPAENASGYYVYRMISSTEQSGVWQLVATTQGHDDCGYVEKESLDNAVYSYKVAAFAKKDGGVIVGESSNVIDLDLTEKTPDFVNMYMLPQGTQIFNEQLQLVYTISNNDSIGCYTGMPDESREGYIAIDFMLTTGYVKASAVKQVDNAVALPTSVVGQEGGKIIGTSACGPTAAAVIVRYDKGETWDKDELIKFAEANKLADQGSMMGEVGEGGMSAPMVIKMIEMYSKGQYTAKNLYSDKEKPSETLKKLIDQGKHSILSVRYAWGIVHHQYSIVHFVEPCAYSIEDGKLYFYYGDTGYGNGSKALVKVAADELDQSVAMVDSEPKCIIVLDESKAQ